MGTGLINPLEITSARESGACNNGVDARTMATHLFFCTSVIDLTNPVLTLQQVLTKAYYVLYRVGHEGV